MRFESVSSSSGLTDPGRLGQAGQMFMRDRDRRLSRMRGTWTWLDCTNAGAGRSVDVW